MFGTVRAGVVVTNHKHASGFAPGTYTHSP